MGLVTLEFLTEQLHLAEQLDAVIREHLAHVHADYVAEFDQLMQRAREEAEDAP